MLPWILGGQMGYVTPRRNGDRRTRHDIAPRLVISAIVVLGLMVLAGVLRLSWLLIVGG